MSGKFLWRGVVLMFFLVVSSVALAQGPVKLDLSSFKVITYTNEQGEKVEKLVGVTNVAPGDFLEWRLRAENTGDQQIEGVVLIIPVPAQTYYVDGSAGPLLIERNGKKVIAEPEFSFDGGRTYGRPPLLKKVKEVVDGKETVKEVPVAPEEYTHVRWVLETMLPGEVVEVFLRTVVR